MHINNRKVQRMYSKSIIIQNVCGHNIFQDTVNYLAQCVGHTQYAVNSNLLDPQYFGHLSCFTISNVNYAFQICEISQIGPL